MLINIVSHRGCSYWREAKANPDILFEATWFFTERCTIVHSAVLSLHFAVRPSVTLVDQDHIGWKSWKLIARTISSTSSLFVAQRPMAIHLLPGEHGEILWRLEVGWEKEKVACGSTKAAMFLKHRWKSYYGRPIGTHQLSFERYHPDPLRPPLPKDWGLQPQPKIAIAIISGTGKTTNLKFGRYIHTIHPNKIPLQVWDKKECRHIQGVSKFFEYPLLSQEGVRLRTSNLAGTFTGPSEQKPVTNVGEKGAWAWPGTAQIFGVLPIISGMGKATNFKFCAHIHRIDRKKSPFHLSIPPTCIWPDHQHNVTIRMNRIRRKVV